MISINEYLNNENYNLIINEAAEGDKEFQNFLTDQQHKAVDIISKRYDDNLKTFFNNLKTFKGSSYQCPMRKNSITVSSGTYEKGNENEYYYYDEIFIQKNSSQEKYAVYLNKKTKKIAIANKIHISYSGNNLNKGCWLQEDGTYSDKMVNKINWLDPSSEAVQKELEKFKA